MTTYWIKPSLDELVDWYGRAEDTATVQVTVRCALEGEETVERVYRYKGLNPVNRELLECLFEPEQLDLLAAGAALVSERLKQSGMMDRAREALDEAGIP